MGSAMQPKLQLAQERADVLDEIFKAAVVILALDRVHLVPQIPGKYHPGRTPSFGGKG